MSATGSRAILVQANHFLSNTGGLGTAGEGGAVYLRENTSFTMTNNMVAGNHASSAGGGLAFGAAAATPVTGTLLHNTFVENDAGVNAGVTTDIDGDARPTGPGYDIGADEYRGPLRLYLPVVLRAGL